MDYINKAGEGSRGGTIIGHAPSGKPIYKKASHESHKTFSPEDHKAAANLHEDIYNRANKKLQDKAAADPGYKPDQKVYDFIQHHHRQMASHTGGGQKPRNVSEGSKGAKAPEKKPEKDPGAAPNASEKKQFKSQLDNKVILDTVNRLRGEGKTAEARRIYDKHINKAVSLLEALGKGGPGSGKRGHQTEGLSEQDLHNRREKFAGSQYAKFRHHSGEGLSDADKFKHGMVQDAKNAGYVKKSEELEKAKYIKREGSKGKYKYTYEKKKKGPRKKRWDTKNFQEVKRDLEIIGDKDFNKIMDEVANEAVNGQFSADAAQIAMVEITAGHNIDQAAWMAMEEIMSDNGHDVNTMSTEQLTPLYGAVQEGVNIFRKKLDKLSVGIENGTLKPDFTPKIGHDRIGLIHPAHEDYDEAKAVAVQMEYFKLDKSKEEEVKTKLTLLTGGQDEKAYHDPERSTRVFNELREIDPALSTALKQWTKHDNKRAKREELTKMATEVLKDRAHLLPDATGPMFRFPGAEAKAIKDIVKNPEDYIGKDKTLKIKDDEFASFSTTEGNFAFDEAQDARKKVMLWIDDEDNPGKLIGNLSEIGSESEALVPPGTEFNVKSVSKIDDFMATMDEKHVEAFVNLFTEGSKNLGVDKIIHITTAKKAA